MHVANQITDTMKGVITVECTKLYITGNNYFRLSWNSESYKLIEGTSFLYVVLSSDI